MSAATEPLSARPFVALSAKGMTHAVDPVQYLRGRDGFAFSYCGRWVSTDHGHAGHPVEVRESYDVTCRSCSRSYEGRRFE